MTTNNNTDNKTPEKQDIKEAIRDISICVQVLESMSLNTTLSRESIKKHADSLSEEMEDLQEYLEGLQ
jgi:hypothetical protein